MLLESIKHRRYLCSSLWCATQSDESNAEFCNSSKSLFLCQCPGDIHVILGALPELSLQPLCRLASLCSVAWKSAADIARMHCGEPNHNAGQNWWRWAVEGDGCWRRRCDCVSICECAFICRNMVILHSDMGICGYLKSVHTQNSYCFIPGGIYQTGMKADMGENGKERFFPTFLWSPEVAWGFCSLLWVGQLGGD